MKKFLSLLLAAMMILSVMPMTALADGMKSLDLSPIGEVSAPADEPAAEPEQQPAEEPAEPEQKQEQSAAALAADNVSVTFKGLSISRLTSFKLYNYNAERTEENNLLANVSLENNKSYTLSLLLGDYWVEAYDKFGNRVGSIAITVTPDSDVFNIHAVFGLGKTGWTYGVDYEISATVKSPDGKITRQLEFGETGGVGMAINKNIMPSILYIDGDSVEITGTPIGDKSFDYEAVTWSPTKSTQDWRFNFSFPKLSQPTYSFTVNAPAGSVITGGAFQGAYLYKYDLMKRDIIKDDETGVTVKFTIKESDTESGNAFFRVQHPDGVTYWDFSGMNAKALAANGWNFLTQSGNEITVTAEDLHIGDSSFTKSTIYRFENNINDRADMYLNINGRGYKNMTVGETFGLNVFRNWQAIDSFANAYIAIPEAHYQVIDVNGQPSDILSIVPEELNSCSATVTANKPGTAVVLVTYDAMTSVRSGSSTENHGFSATWPECTGVFVVTVDADGSGIKMNMTMDRMDSKISDENEKYIDAECDILFYLGSEGAEYSFKPESGCTVTVARSTVSDKMTFSGFTSDGVSVASDGTVTLSGLTTGRHIVKVEKDGVANYQVITARQVTLKLLDKDGNELSADAKVYPGDQVTLQFWGLLSPQEKLATIYNKNFALYYKGSDGSYFRTFKDEDFFGGMYDFSGNPNNQRVTITIPEDWTGTAYSLTGAISLGGFAGPAAHRALTYKYGRPPVFDADSVSGVLTRLPEVTLKVGNKAVENVEDLINAIGNVTKDSGDAIKAAREAYDALTPEQKELVSKEAYATLVKAEQVYSMIVDSNKPDASDKGDKTGSIIKISATGAAKGEENPNTGAPAMSVAPAMLVLAAAALVLKKRG